MINNIFNRLFRNSDSLAELFRTYLVGAFNLLFGLFLAYIFQFIIFTFIDFPLRIYLTNISGFMFGVAVSYLISRKIIFQLSYLDGSIKEFLRFVSINLLNLFVPLLVWAVLDYINPQLQKSEFWVLIVTVIIHGSILPIKYLIYKFFVFKDSL